MADYKDRAKGSFVLRVKASSELDKALCAMVTDQRPWSEDELREVGGLQRTPWLIRQLDKWFDNVRISSEWGERDATLHYVDIFPTAPESVGKNTTDKPHDDIVDDVEWPQVPPLIGQMENFIRPQWFDTMRAMVTRGRNISLAGPPGVGKDTAVQQLAALEGKPLVTVSGDGGFRRRDLVGSQELVNGSSYYGVAEYAAAAVYGWWALVTEVNAADADALLFINSQLAPPYTINVHGKAYPVHPDFRLFVSYNPGLVGTKPLPPAFKDRFYPISIPFFNASSLRARLEAWGMPSDASWADTIVQFGVRMWEAHTDGRMRYQISIRRLIDAVVLMNDSLSTSVADALRMSTIATIDSPMEAKVAEQLVLRTVV